MSLPNNVQELAKFLGQWNLGHLAEPFAADGWLGPRLIDLTREALADLQVPREARSAIERAIKEAMRTPTQDVRQWMTPLAHAAADYAREETARLQLWAGCDLVEMAFRLIVIIALAKLRQTNEGVLPRSRLKRVFDHIHSPTLNHWRAMALETTQLLVEDDHAGKDLGALLAPITALLDGLVGRGDGAETDNLLRLRNMLAHGTVGQARTRALALLWQPRLLEVLTALSPLGALPLLTRGADGAVLRVLGETGRLEVRADLSADMIGPGPGAAAIAFGGLIIPLSPFVLHGLPRVSEMVGRSEVAQIFMRRSDIVLEYMALGAEDTAFGLGGAEEFAAFEQLFAPAAARQDGRQKQPGFEASFRHDAAECIGRAEEIEALWRAIQEAGHAALIWLKGLPGIGKSFLMARLIRDLMDEADDKSRAGQTLLLLPYRFRADQESCRPTAFLRFMLERLADAHGEAAASEVRGLDDRLAVVKLLRLLAGRAKIVIALDGLDEIVSVAPDFLPRILAPLVETGGVWVCAGRSDETLSGFMRQNRAIEPLPNGLEGLSKADIRALILEKAGPLGRKLLQGDREDRSPDEMVNDFIEAVAAKAEGLPIYVRLVIGDILSNRLRFLDLREAHTLPPGLTAYYSALVQRTAVSDEHVLATYALCCLASAYEPLTAAALADLVMRRLGACDRPAIVSALARLSGMIRLGFNPEGDVGYRLYHPSLRDHLRTCTELSITRKDVRETLLCQAALAPGAGAAAAYLHRAGCRHLIDAGRAAGAAALLAGLDRLVERLRCLAGDAAVVDGLVEDWSAVADALGGALSAAQADMHDFILRRGHLLRDLARILRADHALLQLAAHATAWPAIEAATEILLREAPAQMTVLRCAMDGGLAATDAASIVFAGHVAPIIGASALRDGRLLSWAEDGTLRIWHRNGRSLKVLSGHAGAVIGAIERPDSAILSWSDLDSSLRLWDREGQLMAVLAGHEARVDGALVLPDGRMISWAGAEGLHLWGQDGRLREVLAGHVGAALFWHGETISVGATCLNLRTREAVTLSPHAGGMSDIQVLPSGQLMIRGAGPALRVWNQDGSLAGTFDGLAGQAAGALMTPEGVVLCWSETEGDVWLWDPRTDRSWQLEDQGAGTVVGARARADNSFVIWFDGSESLFLRDAVGTAIASLDRLGDLVQGALICADGRILCWTADDAAILWQPGVEGWQELRGHIAPVRGGMAMPDGLVVTWSHGTGDLRGWDLSRLSTVSAPQHRKPVEGLLARPGEGLLSWSSDGDLRLWDDHARPVATLTGHGTEVLGAASLLRGDILSRSGIDHISRGPDSQALHPTFRRTGAAELRRWQADGTPFGGFEGSQTEALSGMLVTRAGRVLSWSHRGDMLRLWSDEGVKLKDMPGHDGDVVGALECSDGRLISWALSGELRQWTADGEPRLVLEGHGGPVFGALALRSGAILSWSADGTLRIWPEDGGASLVLEGHRGQITGAVQMAESTLVSWATDGTVRSWSAEGESLYSLDSHAAAIIGALPLGADRALSWSVDRTLRLTIADGTRRILFRADGEHLPGAIDLDDRHVAMWRGDGVVTIWRRDASLRAPCAAHHFGTAISACRALPGRRLAIGLRSGQVAMLAVETLGSGLEETAGPIWEDLIEEAAPPVWSKSAYLSGNIGVVVNARGKVCMVFDQSFPVTPLWVFYHVDHRTLELVFEDGSTRPVDWQASWLMHVHLYNARKVLMIRMEDRKPVEGYQVVMLHGRNGKVAF